jgi:outer membrane protein assembly factor BamB
LLTARHSRASYPAAEPKLVVRTDFSGGAVLAADGKLYLPSEDGDVFVVKAGRQYELLSRNTMSQPLMASPALSQGMVIIRGEKAISALGKKSVKN